MLEKLNSLYETHRQDLARKHQAALDHGVGAAARLAGIELAPRKSASEELAPGQIKAFEAASAALLKMIVVGSAGMAPNFKKLQADIVGRLAVGGWRIVKTSEQETKRSASVRALDEMIREKGSMAFQLFEPEAVAQTKQSHAERVAQLLKAGEPAENTVIQEWFLECNDLPVSLIHLQWRDVRGGSYTYFNLHLLFDSKVERIAEEMMLSDVIWRCLRSSYRSGPFWGGFTVVGQIFNGGRDGLGVDFVGVTAAEWLRTRLGEIGLPPYAARLSAQMSERML